MKQLIFFLIIFSCSLFGQEYFLADSTGFNKVMFGKQGQNYDVNLYRDSSNQLKTDDDFEANSYRIGDKEVISSTGELKNVTFAAGTKFNEFDASNLWIRGNVIEEYKTNGLATVYVNDGGYNHGYTQYRDYVVGNGRGSTIFSIVGSTATSYFAGPVDASGQTITAGVINYTNAYGDSIVSNKGTFGNMYITNAIKGTGDIDIRPASGYNVAFNWANSGYIYQYNNTTVTASISPAGAIYSASNVDAAAYKVNGSAGASGQVLMSNGLTGAVWGTISAGADTSIVVTKGSTQVASGEKYWTGAQHFTGDILSTYVIRNPSGALDLRAGNGITGQDVAIGYGGGYGDDLINYGGSTTPKFISYANGNGYFAGDLTVADDISVDSIAGYKMWIDTSVTNKATIGNLYVTGTIKVGGANLNFSHLAGAATISQISATGTPSSSTYLRGDGTWSTVAVGGSTFDAISSGTNTGATMTVGSGANLTYTGGGVINANQYQGVTSVSSAEFGYLDGVTSAIQTQLNSKFNNNISTAKVLGRSTSGTGAVEELTIGSGLYLSSGNLSVNYDYVAGKYHSHAISDITGLQTALDNKANKGTTLAAYGITDAVNNSTYSQDMDRINNILQCLDAYISAGCYY